MPNKPVNDLVRSLAQLLNKNDLSEIEYESDGVRIRVARQAAPVTVHQGYPAAPSMPATVAPVPAAQLAEVAPPVDDPAKLPGVVTSPMVGVTYMSPDPASPRFIEVGATVSEGQTLMLIEAMKTYNPIRAPRGGKVVRILVSDGQPVEFGEPLVIVE